MSADNARRDSATTAHGLPFTPSLSPSPALSHSICLFFSIFHLYLSAFISIWFCSDPTPNLLCNLLRVLSTIIDSFLRFAYAKANLQYIYLTPLPPSAALLITIPTAAQVVSCGQCRLATMAACCVRGGCQSVKLPGF